MSREMFWQEKHETFIPDVEARFLDMGEVRAIDTAAPAD
jgi:hypothetical protein